MEWIGMWFGWIFGIVIIWVIITSVSNSDKSRNSQNYLPREDDAMEILKKRYARGEISKEQFEQMKKDLNS